MNLKTEIMLSNEEIAEHLLSDMSAYRENIKEIIVGRLMDSSRSRIYWDAWFRGAERKYIRLNSLSKPHLTIEYHCEIVQNK